MSAGVENSDRLTADPEPEPPPLRRPRPTPATAGEPPTAHHHHHVLIEPEEDRWRWRRRIRQNPRQLRVYRVAVAIAGLMLIALGLVSGPLPGPGGIPLVLLGLAIWASEFEWAHHLMLWFKSKLHLFRTWSRRKQALCWVIFICCCGLLGYTYLLVLGPPGWIPGFRRPSADGAARHLSPASGRPPQTKPTMSAADYPYFDAPFLAFAHRGGATYAPNRHRENSRHAFANAVQLGYRYLETDVHATRDGVLVAFHDFVLDRVTDRPGVLAELSHAEVRAARIHGIDPIPTLDELLESFPTARFNIDAKADPAVELLAATIARHNAYDRVCVAAFGVRRLHRLRRLLGRPVASAASPVGVLVNRLTPWLTWALNTAAPALQIPATRPRPRSPDARPDPGAAAGGPSPRQAGPHLDCR